MNKDFINSKIIITNDLEYEKDRILQTLSNSIVKVFEKEEFILEDAKNVTKEAYIKESKKKYILIIAKSFNIYAQNSLLKILEEPPSNVIFIIVSNSKSNFLPTIRSRLTIENLSTKSEREDLGIDLLKMSLQNIFDFIKKNEKISKTELKKLIQNIFYEAVFKYKMDFTSEEIEVFETSLQLSELNSKADFLLSNIFLTIIQRDELKK